MAGDTSMHRALFQYRGNARSNFQLRSAELGSVKVAITAPGGKQSFRLLNFIPISRASPPILFHQAMRGNFANADARRETAFYHRCSIIEHNGHDSAIKEQIEI